MPLKPSNFRERVCAIVRAIPSGRTLSYRDVALEAGNPKAARAVARIMSQNYDPSIPCHRVIHSNGSVGNYNRGGTEAKRALLQQEGWNQRTH